MIEDLKKNLEHEKKIIEDMEKVEATGGSIDSLKKQLKILNDSVPVLLERVSGVKKLSPEKQKENKKVAKMSYNSPSTGEKKFITINKKDKARFIKELSLSEHGLRKIKKAETLGELKPSKIVHVSNLVFHKFSDKISGKFTSIKKDLREANIRFVISVYISIAIFISLAVFLVSLIGFVLLIVFGILSWIYIFVPFVLLTLTLIGFYFYPAIEKGSVKGKITDELPFATIYMAAIAGSNIEPTRIFKIIANSPEYKNVGIEIKKVINQVEIYGYDLVTSLKNVAKSTPSKKLSELFSGMATNIVSGGSLKNYLEKKSENLLVDYKLERQKYSALAETFMDIYISILITAPLVLMMLFVVMNVTGLGIGLTLSTLLVLTISGVVLVNIIFLVVLHMKQPST